ncbi:hypothetical protein WCP94_000938 [Bilophila wadsworthia]
MVCSDMGILLQNLGRDAPGDPTPKISLPVESSRGGQLMIRLERVERIGEGKLFFRKVFPPQTPPLPFQRLLTLSNPCSQVFGDRLLLE